MSCRYIELVVIFFSLENCNLINYIFNTRRQQFCLRYVKFKKKKKNFIFYFSQTSELLINNKLSVLSLHLLGNA